LMAHCIERESWLMDNVYEDIRRQIDDIISLIDKILKQT
jgi:hypothetical protein